MSNFNSCYPVWSSRGPESAIFNDMIKCYGIDDIIAKNIINLASFNRLSEEETYGVIVGYKCLDSPLTEIFSSEKRNEENIVFIPEIVKNSGATVSLLNAISNLGLKQVKFLQSLLDSSTRVDYKTLGQALVRIPGFKRIQDTAYMNANVVQVLKDKLDEGNEFNPSKEAKTDKGFHYISYIYHDNYIWKLDGKRTKPIRLQLVHETEQWIEILIDTIRDQIELNDLSATILALVANPDANTFARQTVNKVMRYLFNNSTT